MTQLETLLLNGNGFTGTLPEELGNLTNLRKSRMCFAPSFVRPGHGFLLANELLFRSFCSQSGWGSRTRILKEPFRTQCASSQVLSWSFLVS